MVAQLTAPQAARIRELRASGMRNDDVAAAVGVSKRVVYDVVKGHTKGRPLTARERMARDREAGWAPLCMDGGEWADWQQQNPLQVAGAVSRPCEDCLLGFAADMRAQGRCNGTPGSDGGADEPEFQEVPTAEPGPTPEEETVPDQIAAQEPEGELHVQPRPEPDAPRLTSRQRQVLEAVRRHGGNRHLAAKELGVVYQSVDSHLEGMARKGLLPEELLERLPERFRAPRERPATGPAAYGQDEGGPFDDPIERPTPYADPEPNVVPVRTIDLKAELASGWAVKPHGYPDQLIEVYRRVRDVAGRTPTMTVDELREQLAVEIADRAAAGLA